MQMVLSPQVHWPPFTSRVQGSRQTNHVSVSIHSSTSPEWRRPDKSAMMSGSSALSSISAHDDAFPWKRAKQHWKRRANKRYVEPPPWQHGAQNALGWATRHRGVRKAKLQRDWLRDMVEQKTLRLTQPRYFGPSMRSVIGGALLDSNSIRQSWKRSWAQQNAVGFWVTRWCFLVRALWLELFEWVVLLVVWYDSPGLWCLWFRWGDAVTAPLPTVRGLVASR